MINFLDKSNQKVGNNLQFQGDLYITYILIITMNES